MIKSQIVLFVSRIENIGGIETFTYNWCMQMYKQYDILVLYDFCDIKQKTRLIPYVRMIQNSADKEIVCDTLIVTSLFDKMPTNVTYKQKIRMIHSCKRQDNWHIPDNDNDLIIPVSETARESFESDIGDTKCKVIPNITYKNKPQRVLRLISATRMTEEKGENRMIELANRLNYEKIPFIWTVFTKQPLKEMPNGMVFVKPSLDISSYIADSDYLVQLSDTESFCYSIVEALEQKIPVITTPLPVLKEIGVIDGVNGYVLPFSMEDIDINKIYNNRLKFEYQSNNKDIIPMWQSVLGRGNKSKYKLKTNWKVKVIKPYYDLELQQDMKKGIEFDCKYDRALYLENLNLVEVLI